MLVYFETSAVNFVASRLSVADAIATKAFQEVRGRRWAISPVVISEVLHTRVDARREELIYLAQQLFSRELLPSPEEMLVAYLRSGCPAIETPRPLVSASSISKVWRDLCDVPDKTFIFDKEAIVKKRAAVNSLVKDLHRIARGKAITLTPHSRDNQMALMLDQALQLMPSAQNADDEQRNFYKLALFYGLVIICGGLGPDPETIHAYWAPTGISTPGERLVYLLTNHESVFLHGPLACMAHMTHVQCQQKYCRGIFWDSLHSMYVTYVDWFLSEDDDFRNFQEAIGWHINSVKIKQPSQMEWVHETRILKPRRSFLET